MYIESFPTRGSKRQVSRQGGVQPRWRRDGKELFYLTLDQKLAVAPITGDADIRVGAVQLLFQTRLPGWRTSSFGWRTTCDAAADGQKFLLIDRADQEPHVNVILNWPAALKR